MRGYVWIVFVELGFVFVVRWWYVFFWSIWLFLVESILVEVIFWVGLGKLYRLFRSRLEEVVVWMWVREKFLGVGLRKG